MGCWNPSWSEAALSRQEGRQGVLKTQRNRVHLPNISEWGAAPGAGGSRAPPAAIGTQLGENRAGRSAHKNRCTPVPLWSSLGWCWGAGGLLSSMGLPTQNTCRGSLGWAGAAMGHLSLPKHWGYSGLFGALDGLRSLPEHSWGKETADELEEQTGRSQPYGGPASVGLFAWKSPSGGGCAACAYFGGVAQKVLLLLRSFFRSRNCSCFPFTRWGWLFSYFLLLNVICFSLHKRPQSCCSPLHGFGIC